jgi:ADP-heptose:LPS heptosyltransferase
MPSDVAPPAGWEQVRRLLAVRLDNIGDVVMLGPSLRALRAALPSAEITLLGSPAGSEAAPLLPWLDAVLAERTVWQDASAAMPVDSERELRLVGAIRDRGFDAAIIFTSFSQSPFPPAYACYLAGIPIRLGQSRAFGGSLLTQTVKPPPDSTHGVDRNLHLLRAAGFRAAGNELQLVIPADVERDADDLLRGHGLGPDSAFLALAPGASCPARSYDPDRFAAAMRLIMQACALPVVIVAAPREIAIARQIQAALPTLPVVSLAGETSVPQLAAVLRRATLVVANDSGPMHIADAFGRPMVILFSGTELESQWQPRTAPARILRRPTRCAPCYRFQCPYAMECLDIPPEAVAEAALDLLSRTAHLTRVECAAALRRAGVHDANPARKEFANCGD